jgi:hypothetical protein
MTDNLIRSVDIEVGVLYAKGHVQDIFSSQLYHVLNELHPAIFLTVSHTF